jgi:hypothetical protein
MPNAPELGHVVWDHMNGNTRVRVCDDYCRNKTPEEVDAIIRRVSRKIIMYMNPIEKK